MIFLNLEILTQSAPFNPPVPALSAKHKIQENMPHEAKIALIETVQQPQLGGSTGPTPVTSSVNPPHQFNLSNYLIEDIRYPSRPLVGSYTSAPYGTVAEVRDSMTQSYVQRKP